MLTPAELNAGWYTDRHGFLCFDTADQKRDLSQRSAKRKRIFILGASTAEGIDSKNNLGARLQHHLAASSAEVVMATSPGQASMQELLMFMTRVRYMHPDVVITFDGSVDALQGSLLREYTRNGHSYTTELKRKIDADPAASEPPFAVTALRAFSGQLSDLAVVRPFHRYFSQYRNPYKDRNSRDYIIFHDIYDMESPKFRSESVETYLHNLDAIDAIAASLGVKVIHVLQPTLAYDLRMKSTMPAADERDLMVKFARYMIDVKPDGLISAVDRFFSEAETGFTGRPGRNWWNYLHLYDRREHLGKLYIDHVHYTEKQLDLIAERIASDLVRFGYL